jgi:hypothetical protein
VNGATETPGVCAGLGGASPCCWAERHLDGDPKSPAFAPRLARSLAYSSPVYGAPRAAVLGPAFTPGSSPPIPHLTHPSPVHGAFRAAVLGPGVHAGTCAEPRTFQPRLRGFPRFGFSHRGNLLQSLVHCAAGMMLWLILHVLLDPFQILGPETDHAVACLPFQQFAASA